MDAIILVGGKGTRLQSVVRDVPKPMAPIQGRPFLEVLLKQLAGFGGVDRVILATGYKSDVIEEWSRSVAHLYPFEILLSRETDPLGTGGAIRQALDLVLGEDCLVMNGDSFLDFDLASLVAAHRQYEGAITIALTPVVDTGRYGEVEIDPVAASIRGFREKNTDAKPGLINGGIYLIQSRALRSFEKGISLSFEKDMIPRLMAAGMFGHVQEGRFIDIGTEESYFFAQQFFSNLMETGAYESAN